MKTGNNLEERVRKLEDFTDHAFAKMGALTFIVETHFAGFLSRFPEEITDRLKLEMLADASKLVLPDRCVDEHQEARRGRLLKEYAEEFILSLARTEAATREKNRQFRQQQRPSAN